MKTTSHIWNRIGRIAVVLVLLSAWQLAAQQGYRISGNEIQVNTRSHWEQWGGAAAVIDVSPTGEVRPNFIRKNINAALDAHRFALADQGGVVTFSNEAEAANLIDGDLTTTWGPDPDSPLEEWSVAVNLGRVVVANKIVVRFAEEDVGDPFLHFKVLVWRQGPSSTWRQQYTLPATSIPSYWEIGRTVKPNKNERVMEFVPWTSSEVYNFGPLVNDPFGGADKIFVGDPIQSVQIIATDSDFGRAREVSREEYEALPEHKKGAVDHYRRGQSGVEVVVSQEEYEGYSNPERRGPIEYFVKETPRLAEVEVWTPGDNVSLGAFERGGKVIVQSEQGAQDQGSTVTDGNYSTGYNGSADGGSVYEYFQDLGALFWIDTHQFIVDGAYPMDALRIDISDGTLAPDGSIQWTRIGESIGLKVFREFRHEPAKVRFVRGVFENNPVRAIWNLRHTQYIGFTESMFYGEGFVAEVEMTSDLIELGGSKNLISIEWEADTPPGTRVELETRTGDTLLEENIYYDSKGKVVSESRYKKLPSSRKGDISTIFTPSPDWVPWSTAYRVSGEPIKSPSPREYLLVKARLESDEPDLAATLESITVNISDPLADQMVGEVAPNRIQTIGQADEDFSFYIRPVFGSSRQGFDEIRISASTGTSMELVGVRTGTEDDFAAGQPDAFTRGQVEVMAEGADTLWFRLPQSVRRGVELVEVEFRPLVFSNSATFHASVQDSENPGFWQRVDVGDATDLVSSQVTTVLALEGNDVINDLRLDSAVMTPNGDGINDALTFRFDVARITSDTDVQLTIYDLGGALVERIVERRPDPRGSYELEWSGADRSGKRVPPGIYVARVEVEVDSDSSTQNAALRMVYVAY